MLSFRLNEREPIVRQIFRMLRQSIITMQLQPGTALSEKEIADRLGVSRQPVREAFIKLAEAGLVRVLPQRGTFVVKISAKAVTNARFVREAVEVALAKKACQVFGADEIRTLRGLIDEQRAAAEANDHERFLALDEEFHRFLALGIDCEYAWRVVEDVKTQMDRVRFLSLSDASPMSMLIDQHQAIVEAIAARDEQRAEAAVRLHMSEILKSLPKLAAAHPDMFDNESVSPALDLTAHARTGQSMPRALERSRQPGRGRRPRDAQS